MSCNFQIYMLISHFSYLKGKSAGCIFGIFLCISWRESNTYRFWRADFRPCCVKALDNTTVFSASFALPEQKSAPAKLRAPVGCAFRDIFGFLWCRWAGAHQDKKGENSRKGALTGDMGSILVSLYFSISAAPILSYTGLLPICKNNSY